MGFYAREMQYDINKRLAEWRLREQTDSGASEEAEGSKKEASASRLQRLRKEDRRSKLVEEETVRRAEKEARRGARAEEKM